jgi:hypothetical protein
MHLVIKDEWNWEVLELIHIANVTYSILVLIVVYVVEIVRSGLPLQEIWHRRQNKVDGHKMMLWSSPFASL